ncbi:MAG: CHAP domain-containing protein, partial [Anaerolineales bacterium]
NGSQVVWNYSEDLLEKIGNGTTGIAPQPDDVLSYGSTSTWGHTSVVIASNVDANGNGSITIMEQNASATGSNTLPVYSWVVSPSWTNVSGWLHDPSFKGKMILVLLIRVVTPTPTPDP